MNGPQKRPSPPVEVSDPEAAMQKMRELGRKILSVPKGEIDAAGAREKAAKKKSKRR